MEDIWNCLLTGGIGGAVAGITFSFVQSVCTIAVECIHKDRVYTWLSENIKDEPGSEYRSTRAIASWTNLTEDRVRYICSIHEKIYLSTGDREDLWTLYQ